MASDPAAIPASPSPASPRKILAATGLALGAAAIALVVAVLPAEYGLDPLGVGRALGLTALAGGSQRAVAPQSAVYQHDSVEFVLGPYQSVEYKYRIELGASMLYSWEATRPVSYDFHAEPDGAPEGYAESFDKQESARADGTYTAPFSGIHGWYWENMSLEDVSIRLTTAGFYREPREYFDGNVFPRELSGLPASGDR